MGMYVANLSKNKFRLLILVLGFVAAFSTILSQTVEAFQLYDSPASNTIYMPLTKEQNEIITGGKCPNNAASTGFFIEFVDSLNEIVSLPGRDSLCAVTNISVDQDAAVFNNLLNNYDGGLLGAVTAINTNLINQRPGSGTEFLQNKVYALMNNGKVRAAPEDLYYRGTGFDLLKPVQSFWGWSVNIVYGLLIFIIIGIAFAIMFRQSLGGGTVVTLQTAIPNIAMAMILVPLSYAISGLFIDGITLGVNVVHEFLVGPGAPAREVYDQRNDTTVFPPIQSLEGIDPRLAPEDRGLHADDLKVSWLYSGALISVQDETYGFIQNLPVLLAIQGALGGIVGGAAGLISTIVQLIVGLLLLLTGLRIFWALLNKYIVFILGPIFAPFIFATVAIPGQGMKSVMGYCKMLGAGTLYYIVAYAMILLSIIFSSAAFQAKIAGLGFSSFTPPLLGLEAIFNGTAGAQVPTSLIDFYCALISLVIYAMIPKTLKNIDSYLGVDTAMPFIGDAIQSAKDSWSLGKNIAGTPGRLAAGAGKLGSSALNAAQTPWTVNQARIRAWQGLNNIIDRTRGIKPGEQGSRLFARQQALTGQIADYNRRADDAAARGDYATARWMRSSANAQQRELDNINKGLGTGIAASGAGKAAETTEKGLQAEVTISGKPTPFLFNEGMYKTIRAAVAPAPGQPAFVIKGGNLKLTAKGFKLTPDIIRRIAVYRAAENPNYPAGGPPPGYRPGGAWAGANGEALHDANTRGVQLIAAGELERTIMNPRFPFLPGGFIDFLQTFPGPLANVQADATNIARVVFRSAGAVSRNADSAGATWNADFEIQIMNPAAFLGRINPLAPAMGNKVMFVIEGINAARASGRRDDGDQEVDSNPVRVAVGTEWVP